MLTEYDIVYVSRTAIKGQAVADYLAAQALPDYQPLQKSLFRRRTTGNTT